MNSTHLVSLLISLGLLLTPTSFASEAWISATSNQYIPDQVLVKFKPRMAAVAHAQVAQTYGAQAMQAVGNHPDLMVARLARGQTVAQAVDSYNNDPDVEYAQPNYIYRALAVPADPEYGQLWAAKNTGQLITTGSYWLTSGAPGNDMNLEAAWDIQTDCSPVVVAVVDTGINYRSTDLVSNMWMGNANHGQNFASDVATGANSDPMDLAGHGTHVAGIIGAVANNGTAGAGVCWTAKLMAVRVLDATGYGTTSSIIQGIAFAVTNGANVINMSLGGGGAFDQAFSDAITNAQSSNVLVVVAAGNEGSNNEATPSWPCNFTHTNLICVAALDQNYALASFSNWGTASVDVGAPGTNIYSTWAGVNATITDQLNTGWSTSTSNAGGFFYGSASTPYGVFNAINNPGTWPTGKYKANTTDHAWKTFDLGGVNAATIDILYSAFHVTSDGSIAIAQSISGGDPFAPLTPAYLWGPYYTDFAPASAPRYEFWSPIIITNCFSATCTIGFELKTGATLNLGASIAYLKIETLTLNSTSTNTIDGTSMATPEVAGVAALVWAYNPQYTYADVANAVQQGGRSIPALSGISKTGKAVDALGSLTYINPPTGIVVAVQ